MQHLRKVGVDDLRKELVLGDVGGRHDDLNLSETTARNENKGFLRDTEVKTFVSIYNEFLPTKRSNPQENGVRESHGVPTRQGARPGKGRALHPRGRLVSLPDSYLFFYFSKYSKTEKNYL